MSLKSFDDFCAKVINGDPVDTKDVFDKRQSVLRTRITMEAMRLFIILTCLNMVIMEAGPAWCESIVAPTGVFYMIAYIYWLIKNSLKSSLFGLKGTISLTNQAIIVFSLGIIMPFFIAGEREDFFECFFIRNGMVSENVILMLFCVLCIISEITVVVLARRYNKRRSEDKN